jgi:hypothetical protein
VTHLPETFFSKESTVLGSWQHSSFEIKTLTSNLAISAGVSASPEIGRSESPIRPSKPDRTFLPVIFPAIALSPALGITLTD